MSSHPVPRPSRRSAAARPDALQAAAVEAICCKHPLAERPAPAGTEWLRWENDLFVDWNRAPRGRTSSDRTAAPADGSARVTVHLTFRPPPRTDRPNAPTRHHRSLPDVPASVAENMARDFRAYQTNPAEETAQKLYRYRPSGDGGDGKRLTPLDFREIVGVTLDRTG